MDRCTDWTSPSFVVEFISTKLFVIENDAWLPGCESAYATYEKMEKIARMKHNNIKDILRNSSHKTTCAKLFVVDECRTCKLHTNHIF